MFYKIKRNLRYDFQFFENYFYYSNLVEKKKNKFLMHEGHKVNDQYAICAGPQKKRDVFRLLTYLPSLTNKDIFIMAHCTDRKSDESACVSDFLDYCRNSDDYYENFSAKEGININSKLVWGKQEQLYANVIGVTYFGAEFNKYQLKITNLKNQSQNIATLYNLKVEDAQPFLFSSLTSKNQAAAINIFMELWKHLERGGFVVFHCRAGIGRSGQSLLTFFILQYRDFIFKDINADKIAARLKAILKFIRQTRFIISTADQFVSAFENALFLYNYRYKDEQIGNKIHQGMKKIFCDMQSVENFYLGKIQRANKQVIESFWKCYDEYDKEFADFYSYFNDKNDKKKNVKVVSTPLQNQSIFKLEKIEKTIEEKKPFISKKSNSDQSGNFKLESDPEGESRTNRFPILLSCCNLL